MERNDSLGELIGLVKIDTTVAPFIGNSNSLNVVGNGGLILPKGNLSQRPTDTEGMIRYNTETSTLEINDGVGWYDILTNNGLSGNINVALETGTSFPIAPTPNQLFYATSPIIVDLVTYPLGLYYYDDPNTAWNSVDPAYVNWSVIDNKPTTLAGYGITDAQSSDADLTAIAALAGTNGFLKKTATDTWTLDTNTYLTAHPTISGATSANNSGLTYIQDLTFDTNGHVTGIQSVVIQSASTSQSGVVQLSDSTATTSSILGATSTAVKGAYDLASAALPKSGGTMTGSIVIPTGQHITVTDAPVNGTDAVNKNYVDANLAGLSWKNSVKAATTANITLSGTQTIDGVALVVGNRVLVKNQTTTYQNGIYVVSAGTWSRATDMDATTPLNEINSAAVFVEQGTVNADTGWTQTFIVNTIDSDQISFTQFNGASGITAGIGLLKTGNTLDVNLGAGIAQLPTDEVGIDVYATGGLMTTVDGTTSSTLTNAQLSLTKVGTAGTYKSVTTDDFGRVTAGSNPTTLAGYGITDAAPSSHTTDQTLHLTSAQNTWIDAITVTSAEVNYLSGVTSAVQTQIDSKFAKTGGTIAGNVNIYTTGNAALEMGRLDGISATPYIDFHSGVTVTDYDSRIIAGGGNGTSGQGTLSIIAGGGLTLTGPITASNTINGTTIPTSKTLLVTTDIDSTVQAYDADLSAIGALVGTTGILTKTAANTWSLDTTAYAVDNTVVHLAGVETITGAKTFTNSPTISAAIPGIYLTETDAGVDLGKWTVYVNSGVFRLQTLTDAGIAVLNPISIDRSGNTTIMGTVTADSFNSITGLSSTSPVMNGTAAVGTGTTVARADHVHPSDTSKLSLSGGTMTGSIVIPTGQHITVTDAPVNGTDAVNKNYVDANLAGLSWKDSVRIATTANITLSGLQTIDGLAVTAGMRVLVKDQTTASQNGIYVASATAWTRADDMDATTPINELNSAAVFVEGGSTQQDTGWTQINAVTTLGTDTITFTQFNGAAGITAGIGLTKTGNQLDISLGAGIAQLPTDEVGIDVYATGGLMTTVDGTASSTLTNAQLSLTKVGTAGTYKSVTTDAYGRITAGTNPTTLAGYGITDASLNTHTHILDGLSDVTITTNTAGEILKWDGAAWVNNTLAEAGIQAAGSYQLLDADLTSWAGVTRAAGFDTFVTTPSSANLATLVTDQTGTGTLVFATSPTLVTPNIGVATGTSFNSITGLSSTSPVMDGTAAVGTGTTVARADHVHPSDTSKLSLAGGTMTGNLTLSSSVPSIYFYETDAAVDTRHWLMAADGSLFQIQTRTDANAYVDNVMTLSRTGNVTFGGTLTGTSFNSITGLSSTTPSALGTAAVGTGVTVARADHVHAMPTLDALSNTTITSNTSGEILKWNGTAWVNNTLVEAGIQAAGSYQPLDADLTSWAGVTRAAGIDTFVTTPTSANLAAVVTDETGSGALVFANSPTLTGTVSAAAITSSGLITANAGISIPTGQDITIADAPVNGTDAANKNYVDSVAAGLTWKNSVKAATTANVTLAGGAPNTLDGVTLAANDRVLVKNQTTTAQNGIYVVTTLGTGANGTWTRATDMDQSTPINEFNGAGTLVVGGTTYNDTAWTVSSTITTVGTDPVTWAQFSGASVVAAGTGLTLTGNSLSVNASQTQITSVGTLGSLAVTGAVTGASFNSITGLSSTTPSALGTAAVGTGTTTARADHVHAMPTLDALSNTTITSNVAGEILKWNGTAWVNNTLAEAGIQAAGSYQPLDADLTSWAGVTRAAGFDAFTATPSSANLATLVTDETGSGSLVFATSPTLVTPNIGVATGTSFNSITGLSSTTPLIDGAAAIGTSTTTARADHVHPTDTTRAQDSLVVHLAGTETITGYKTFSTGPLISTADTTIQLNIRNTSSTASRWPGLVIDNYLGSTAGFPVLEMRSTRGTLAAPTAVQTSDILGSMAGWGWNGTAFDDVARIYFKAASNFDGVTDDGQIEFYTQSGTTLSKRMQIDAAGNTSFYPGSITGNFYMGGTTNPMIAFDNTDYFSYDRTANAFNFVIGSTNELSLTSSTATFGGSIVSNGITATGLSAFINGTATGGAEIVEFKGTDYGAGNPYLYIKHSATTANEYAIGLWDGTSAEGVINFGSRIATGRGVELGNNVYPTYELNLDFGSDVANTWKKIIGIACANTAYSTHGFIVEIFDPQANHAPLSTVGAVIHETYYVACTYSNDTVIGTPDDCAVSGPGSRVRAIKTAAGIYEVHVQNLTQYRECKIKIHSYASNSSHTINYFDGATVGTAIETYNAAVSASTDVFQEVDVRGTSASTSTTTGALVVSGGVGIAGDTYVGGHISIPDNKNLYVGTGNDLYATHDGVNSTIVNQTGTLFITNTAAGGALVLRSENTSGSNIELWSASAYIDATTTYFRNQAASTTYATFDSSKLQSNVPIMVTSTALGGQFDIVNGSASAWYKSMIRNDGTNWYFLVSDVQTTQANAIAATWSTARPLSINLTTGSITLDSTGAAGTSIGGNLTVSGNLTVNGTTTTINATTLTVDDKNIELGSVTTPTNTTADGGGITLKGTTDKTIIWDNANTNWTSSESWNLVTGASYKINNVTLLNATTLGSSVVNSSLTSVGTITTGTWNAGSVTSSGAITSNNHTLTNGNITSATLTTSTTTANQVIMTLSSSTYRTVEYLIQATSGTSYHTTKVHLIHNGTDVWIEEYGTIFTGTSLATFSADISGGNIRLLLATVANAVTTIKVIATAINI